MSIVQKRLLSEKKKTRIKKLNKLAVSDDNVLFKTKDNLEVIEDLMEEIAKLGLPFYRHQKSSKVYYDSAKRLLSAYKKYRSEVFVAFKLGYEFLNNPYFVFRPAKISVDQFLRFTTKNTQRYLYAKSFSEKYKIKSLFKEFLKGRKYIEINYLKIKMLEVEGNLLVELVKICDRHKLEVNDSQIYLLSKFITICQRFSEKNKNINIRNIFYLLDNDILSNRRYNISRIEFLNSESFWWEVLPKSIVSYGLLASELYIRKINIE